MSLNPNTVQSLAFIRYLYKTSTTQSKLPEPLCGASILTIHDAIELFLGLSAEHLNVNCKSNINFMEYWDPINDKLKPDELGHKVAMSTLNTARKGLKHSGAFPNKHTINTALSNAEEFLFENIPKIFDIDFESVSLVDFVNPEMVKDCLKKAEIAIQKEDKTEALNNTARAFDEMLRDYENQASNWSHRYIPHDKVFKPFSRLCDPFLRFDPQIDSRGTLADLMRDIKDSLEATREAIKIIGFGLNYRMYAKFKMITPYATRMGDDSYHFSYHSSVENIPIEEVEFCLDFVIESYLCLAEFDYSSLRPY